MRQASKDQSYLNNLVLHNDMVLVILCNEM